LEQITIREQHQSYVSILTQESGEVSVKESKDNDGPATKKKQELGTIENPVIDQDLDANGFTENFCLKGGDLSTNDQEIKGIKFFVMEEDLI
jgi:hypothetical protein